MNVLKSYPRHELKMDEETKIIEEAWKNGQTCHVVAMDSTEYLEIREEEKK